AGGDQRLALAGDHLRDVVAVQGDAAEDLDVVVPHVLGAAGCLAARGKRLGQQILHGLPRPEPLAGLWGELLQLRGGEGLHCGLELRGAGPVRGGGDCGWLDRVVGGNESEFADEPLVAGPEQAGDELDGAVAEVGELLPELFEEAHFELGVGSRHRGPSYLSGRNGPARKVNEKADFSLRVVRKGVNTDRSYRKLDTRGRNSRRRQPVRKVTCEQSNGLFST